MDEANTEEVNRELDFAQRKAERLCRLMDHAVSEGNTERVNVLKGEIIEAVKEAGRLSADKKRCRTGNLTIYSGYGYEKKDDKNVTEGF